MLDLKDMERRLDEAIAKATPEELTAWLMSKRLSMPQLTKGKIAKLPVRHKSFIIENNGKSRLLLSVYKKQENIFLLAA
ncbi:MAG: hypothetical protein AAB316_22105 [Bacteroidota bacterium]